MKKSLIAILVLVAAAAWAEPVVPVQSTTGYSSAIFDCPEKLNEFKPGEAASFVKTCIGEPYYVDQNADGRFVYIYNLASGYSLAYLFDAKGALVRLVPYKRPPQQ